jgi:dihydropteroate synthase
LVFQIFRISDNKTFREFSNTYKIFREVYDPGLYGLEMRNIPVEAAEEIFKIIIEVDEICYKKQSDDDITDLFIPGTINELKKMAKKVISSGNEDVGYRMLGTISNFEGYDKIKYVIGRKEFIFNQAFIMGILNVTPDSFSDGGLFYNVESAVKYGTEMFDSGADIIDVGGESTRPGAVPVNTAEELNRVIPVIEALLLARPDMIISVDTSKSRVAEEALKKGALIVNDISGLRYDPLMAKVVKNYDAALIIMHIKGTPKDMQDKAEYENVVKEVFNYLQESSAAAQKKGIMNIIIDPGIGFAKTAEHNFELLRRLHDFKCMGFPILAGVSRKSFLGKILEVEVSERDTPTAVAEAAAIINGARIIRTHNVKYGKYVSTITGKFL